MSREYCVGPVTEAEKAKAEVKKLTAELAECYRLTGAEPAGVDSMDAAYAVREVERLREECDEAE